MSKKQIRPIIIIFFALLMATGVVLTAHAGPPVHVPRVTEFIPDIQGCDVNVSANFYFAKGNDKLFFDDDGNLIRVVPAGPYRALLESEFASVDLVNAGSAQVRINPDGSQHIAGHGRILGWDLNFVNEPDFPGIALITGYLELEIDADGAHRLLELNGNVEDLCPILEGN